MSEPEFITVDAEKFKTLATAMIGAVNSYEKHASRAQSRGSGRAKVDPFFKTRINDMYNAACIAEAMYQEAFGKVAPRPVLRVEELQSDGTHETVEIKDA